MAAQRALDLKSATVNYDRQSKVRTTVLVCQETLGENNARRYSLQHIYESFNSAVSIFQILSFFHQALTLAQNK